MNECQYIQRCVSVDYYLAPPLPHLDPPCSPLTGAVPYKVPVLRLYGATQMGQKACLHVHSVFPYLYIPTIDIERLQLCQELEGALARSYGATQGQYIHDIREEKGIPFYGYHEREVSFLKVVFYQPRFVTRCAEILLQGCIRGGPVQPFESHFPYTLQFLTDYNIHGMNMVNLSKVWFRTSTPPPSCTSTPDYISSKISAIATSDLLDPELAPKSCCSELEADCRGQDVLNVLFIDIKSNPGLKAICDEERDRRHNAGHFTPTQLHKSLIRNAETHSQTIKWEMKLGSIISHLTQVQASFTNSALQRDSQGDSLSLFDDEVVDFLDVLGKSYSQHTFSQPSVPSLSSQTDRKSPVFRVKDDDESDEDDDVNVSIMMTQKIFYPTIEESEQAQHSICSDNLADKSLQSAQKSPVLSSNHSSNTSLPIQAIKSSLEQVVNSDSDDSLSCDISDSQLAAAALDCDMMLQVDGNSELPVVRKSKRLGGRVPLSSMISRPKSEDKKQEKDVPLVEKETKKVPVERKGQREKAVLVKQVDETVLEPRCEPKTHKRALPKFSAVADDERNASIAGFRVAVGRTGASLRRVNGIKQETVSKEANVRSKKTSEVCTHKEKLVTPGPSHQTTDPHVCEDSPQRRTRPSLTAVNSPSSTFDLTHFKELQESPSRKVKRKQQIRSLSLKRRAKKEKVLPNSQSSADVEPPRKPRALFTEDIPATKPSQGARRVTMSQFLAAVKEHTLESCDEIVESSDLKPTEDIIDSTKFSSLESDTTDVIKSDSSGQPAIELCESINCETSEDMTQSSQEIETAEEENTADDMETEEEETEVGKEESVDKRRYTPSQATEASCSKYDHVMMWLSESSQDEGEDEPQQNKTLSPAVKTSLGVDSLPLFSPEEVSEGSPVLSSPHIVPSSPLIDIQPLPCNESTPHVQRFRKASTLSDSTTKTIFSSPQILSSPQIFSSPQILSSPELLSSSYTSSTPGIEFISSFFVSQIEHAEPPVLQSMKYCVTPPTLSSVMRQNYEGEESVAPFYSSEVSKSEPFQHETESGEGAEGYCKSELVTTELKYVVRPPSLKDVRKWLADKSDKKGKEVQMKPAKPSPKPLPASATPFKPKSLSNPSSLNTCSTPLSSHSLLTPLTKFTKKNIFSPGSPLSPTLAQNSDLFPSNTSFTSAPVPDHTKSHAVQHLTVLSIECFASGVGDKLPNPKYDPVLSLFYSVYNDSKEGIEHGIICIKPNFSPLRETEKMTVVESEGELFEEFFLMLDRYDPDIITGYEITKTSLGYVIERGNVIGLNLQGRLSRFPEHEVREKDEGARSSWWVNAGNEVTITGRVIIGLWRLMRTELTLTNYSFENIVHHVLKERIPCYTNKTLLSLYSSPLSFHSFIEYYMLRSQVNIRLLLDLNIIIRTSEQARLFGIDFYSVLSRGSQFRVESMMTRLAKPRGFISISPSPEQRIAMAAPELIPLVMEPESCFYSEPVVVLDFQSLYPTMIIAYNMCFSTCLGRVNSLGTGEAFPLGTTMHTVPPELLIKYKNNIFVSPNGVAFVDKTVRHGVLPMMLSEILQTRIMVKEMMKRFKDDKSLYKMLDAKQMALKLIANVTYGYTSANFSGRMPCIEIGDSIVAKGRETLEAAIDLVNETAEWGGRVVYGDTDSLFILFKGCSKDEAFRRGREIAKVVSERNPDPVKLKFEKVYMPCILQTKKRYVGMKFEREDETEGEYEAKGIETVRRDGCPIGVKILKQALLTLFSSKDLTLVKEFVQHQFTKMIHGKVSLQDYIFAKEFRGMDGYKPGVCVPALEIARRRIKKDSRNDPVVSERVQYVVCYGSPGLPLIQLIHEPAELFTDTSLKLNTIYYITKAVLPVLQRALGLVGVNVTSWYHELPLHLRTHTAPRSATSHRTISHYYSTKHCTICDKVSEGLCSCYSNPQKVAVVITQRLNILENQLSALRIICKDCSGLREEGVPCVSVMCPVLYKKVALTRDHDVSLKLRDQVNNLYDW